MAIGAGRRCALENALHMAAFAGGVAVHAGQGESRLIMVETRSRTRAFGRHR